MCNRFAAARVEQIKQMVRDVYGVDVDTIDWTVRFNVAPNSVMPIVVTNEEKKPVATSALWNLIPAWSPHWQPAVATDEGPVKKPREYLMTNARSEEVFEKKSYRQPLQERRCLVPASAFFEWEWMDPAGKVKVPWAFELQDGAPFMFAGLWSKGGSNRPPSFTILTTTPNALVGRIHNRMPVLLPEKLGKEWLTPGPMTKESLAPFVVPFPPEKMRTFRVSTALNSVRNDTPEAAAAINTDEEPKPPAAPNEPAAVQGELF